MDAERRRRILDQGPIGRWRAALGTAGVLSADEIEFRADGTGRLEAHTFAFGAESIDFFWRMAGPAALEIQEILDAEDDEEWSAIAMEFRRIDTDVGAIDALVERGLDVFWLMPSPITLSGD